jgi:hypothetical protein
MEKQNRGGGRRFTRERGRRNVHTLSLLSSAGLRERVFVQRSQSSSYILEESEAATLRHLPAPFPQRDLTRQYKPPVLTQQGALLRGHTHTARRCSVDLGTLATVGPGRCGGRRERIRTQGSPFPATCDPVPHQPDLPPAPKPYQSTRLDVGYTIQGKRTHRVLWSAKNSQKFPSRESNPGRPRERRKF